VSTEEQDEPEMSLREQKDLWQSLLAHAGWRMLEAMIREQVNGRKQLIFSPLESADAAFAQEYLKGEAAFGELVLQLPTTALEQVQIEIDRIKSEAESNSTQGDEE
jgi:hypothetical protein